MCCEIKKKRDEGNVVSEPQRGSLKRKEYEMQEVAWEEDIHQRRDGRIFNQYSGFIQDLELKIHGLFRLLDQAFKIRVPNE